jgi:hypothetical protein
MIVRKGTDMRLLHAGAGPGLDSPGQPKRSGSADESTSADPWLDNLAVELHH